MTITHIYSGTRKELGTGFSVRRLLPGQPQRAVGPFIFFDHFGPVEIAPNEGFDVRPHPHIGLATVTYLFEGAMIHRDSVGSVQRIEPGAINWMTAGHGIVHSERATDENRLQAWRCHGLQLWVALPHEHEETTPDFSHYPAGSIPKWRDGVVTVRLLAGTAARRRSPVVVLSELVYLDLLWESGGEWDVPDEHTERALYAVSGSLNIDGTDVPAGRMALLAANGSARVQASAGTRAVMIGGAPLDGPRHIWWNFVSSQRARIEQAKADWEMERFPEIAGEHERIPLPR